MYCCAHKTATLTSTQHTVPLENCELVWCIFVIVRVNNAEMIDTAWENRSLYVDIKMTLFW